MVRWAKTSTTEVTSSAQRYDMERNGFHRQTSEKGRAGRQQNTRKPFPRVSLAPACSLQVSAVTVCSVGECCLTAAMFLRSGLEASLALCSGSVFLVKAAVPWLQSNLIRMERATLKGPALAIQMLV